MKRWIDWGMFVSFLCCTIWTIEINYGRMPFIDQWSRFIVSLTADTIVYDFFYLVTGFGSKPFTLPFTMIMSGVLWWLYRNAFPSIFFISGVLTSHMLNQWMKTIFMRERPSSLEAAHALGYSFPSGHAMISIMLYGLLLYFLLRKSETKLQKVWLKRGFGFVIISIGLSRFFINVHYITDVLTGYLIGYFLLTGFIWLFELVEQHWIDLKV